MFHEANTVEQLLLDAIAKVGDWQSIPGPELPRGLDHAMVEEWVRDAILANNPTIASQPERADEVLYKLRACIMSVHADGLVRANENFMAWLRGEKTMPFGENGEHVPIKFFHDDPAKNRFVVSNQVTFEKGAINRRPDIVLWVNGFPLVIIEAKTPVRPAVSWVDGADDIYRDYEVSIPELFVPSVMNIAADGKELRYGTVRMPIDLWGPWRTGDAVVGSGMKDLEGTIQSMVQPEVLMDFLQNFTLFATDDKNRRIKIIARYQQFEGANAIVQRVIEGKTKKGLIWHFQGSGKSLLMVFAAQKLRLNPELKNPTVLIVVDRIDLDSQISATFHGADIPNLVKATGKDDLQQMLAQDVRKIIITTIFKFQEARGSLNDRDNIIVMVDEAHRTQEGDLGMQMRQALPNAFLFGLTGTPINRADKNTFKAFGADEDGHGYMSKYGFEESIRDGATLPLHFEPRLVDMHIDQDAIDAAYADLTGGLSDLDKEGLAKQAAKMAVLVKNPERVQAVCEDIALHFDTKVRPNGFKGQVVAFDREACILYKEQLDELMGPDASDIIMTVNAKDGPEYNPYKRDRDAEEKILDRFRDPKDPLQILIVTAKLLTGFDAPILQAMYLDKPLKNHTLLQAICRTNRTRGKQKTHGLIVDYLGVFDNVAKSLEFDEEGMKRVVNDIANLAKLFPEAIQNALAHFEGVDRSLTGYEGLIAAQEALPTNDLRDAFAQDFKACAKLWEAISPDTFLQPYKEDYRWLTQVYESIQPPGGHGKLLWQALGAKTLELIHDNVHVDAVRDDLDKIVLDADVLDAVLNAPNAGQKAIEISIKIIRRLKNKEGNPNFKHLGERLEKLRERHEAGTINSVEFLRELLKLAKEVVQAEKDEPPEPAIDQGKAALTDLFEDVKNEETPILVEKVVEDIDSIVRIVRFDGWQATAAGTREVKLALRKTLFQYKLHAEQELFDRAYGYIEEYY